MIIEDSQAVITFYQEGAIRLKGSNAANKNEIRKIMSFSGAVDPETGKFSKILNVDWYIKNKKPFPKKYYWAKNDYIPPILYEVTRKLHWNWDQIQAMLETPIKMNDKQWQKLTDEQKIKLHAQQCMLPGEFEVSVEYVM